MVSEVKVQRCWFCGHDEGLKPFMPMHVGGKGPVMQYHCDDPVACLKRQAEADREWRQATKRE